MARVLGTTQVLEVRRLNLADGEPFARVTVWCPEALGASISRADVERATFYELLDVPLGGAVQTIGAAVASPEDAALLEVPVGSPVLRCERTTSTPDGTAVLLSEHVFPAHRTEFVVDLPLAERSIAPSGLRLLGPGEDLLGTIRPLRTSNSVMWSASGSSPGSGGGSTPRPRHPWSEPLAP